MSAATLPSSPGHAGSLLIVVAPSGAGKTSLVRALLAARSDLRLSVSCTTRAPRAGEADGVDYFFIDADEFDRRRRRGEFIEWAFVHGNYYGTSRRWIEEQIALGVDIVLEIDWQGAAQLRRVFDDAVTVFIAPPSLAVLRQRLTDRGQDTAEVIERRMAAARSELAHAGGCQYVIINQEFAAASRDLIAIADAARSRFRQQNARHPDLFAELGMAKLRSTDPHS
ncbi:MAG TPA: guanylate kinase [Burkholderiaceae bacterium]|nr:guanylate kinase [Burkholderiaceae bacterium]